MALYASLWRARSLMQQRSLVQPSFIARSPRSLRPFLPFLPRLDCLIRKQHKGFRHIAATMEGASGAEKSKQLLSVAPMYAFETSGCATEAAQRRIVHPKLYNGRDMQAMSVTESALSVQDGLDRHTLSAACQAHLSPHMALHRDGGGHDNPAQPTYGQVRCSPGILCCGCLLLICWVPLSAAQGQQQCIALIAYQPA